MSLDIKLDENYRIRSDPHNYILEYKAPPEEGKKITKTWKAEGYYGKLSHLARAYLNKKIRRCNATDLLDIGKVVDEAMDNIKVTYEHLPDKHCQGSGDCIMRGAKNGDISNTEND